MKAWLSRNLAALTVVGPLLLVIIVSVVFVNTLGNVGTLDTTMDRSQILQLSNTLLHEVQKERGITAGFLGSQGRNFATEIVGQRRNVDNAAEALSKAADENDDVLIKSELFDPVFEQLRRLSSMRSSVDDLSMSLTSALQYYTDINRFILDFNGVMAKNTPVPLFKQKFTVLYTISFAKEASGIERALLSNAFSAGQFSTVVYSRWLSNTAQQVAYLDASRALAPDEFKPFLDQFIVGNANAEVQRYRDHAQAQGLDPLDRSATEWFAASTARINELKDAEEELFAEILVHAEEEIRAAWLVMLLELLLLISMLALAGAIYSLIKARRSQSTAIAKVMVAVAERRDLSEQVEIITQDDLGQVATALNTTLAELRKDFAAILQYSQEIASASTETAATTEQTNVNIANERESISACRKSTEELNSSIDDDLVNIDRVSRTASQARQTVSNGETTVATAVAGIKTTAEEVQKVGDIIAELDSRVDDILGMVDVIRSVADQTNLLALNAAIEAARAGEQGRGFAVVADEVRALAQRTQESTEQISNVVDELTTSSNRAIQSVEQGNMQATEAVSLAELINKTLSSVTENMVTLDEIAQLVSQSAQTQQSAVGQMTDEMRNIDVMSQENTTGVEHIATAANQLSSIANDMLQRVKRYAV